MVSGRTKQEPQPSKRRQLPQQAEEEQLKQLKEPRGDEKIGAKAPEDREQNGRKDTAKDGGVEADTAEASPTTASEGPAAARAGVRDDPSRDGGGPRTGGTRLGIVRTSGRTPEPIAVETRMTDGAGTFDSGAVLEEPSAAP